MIVARHEDKEDFGAICRPGGARGFSPGFQPWEPPARATRPERAPDQTYSATLPVPDGWKVVLGIRRRFQETGELVVQ
jgi:hypothetical protein